MPVVRDNGQSVTVDGSTLQKVVTIGPDGLSARGFPFLANSGGNKTRSLTVTATPTTSPGMPFPIAAAATSVRVKVRSTSAGPCAWTLGDGTGDPPIVGTPADGTGAGGTAGDRTIDPGGVEVFSLSATQIALLAAGTLRARGVCPAGTGVIEFTFGDGD